MFASVLQLVLIEDDIEHVGGTLGQLLRSHHLHRQVLGLPLAAGLDQPLQYLQTRQQTSYTLLRGAGETSNTRRKRKWIDVPKYVSTTFN